MCVPWMTPIILGNPGSVCSSKFCMMTSISSSVKKVVMMGSNSNPQTNRFNSPGKNSTYLSAT